MTKRKFMLMDISLLTILACVFEIIGLYFIQKMANPLFYVSLNIIFVLIIMFRWGWIGVLITVPLSIISCLMLNGSFNDYIIQIVGSLAISINLIWFKIKSKKVMSKNLYWIILYTITGYVSVLVSTSILEMLFGKNIGIVFNQYFVAYAFSIIMGIVIMIIIYYQKTILVDINDYLISVQKEEVKSHE